MSGEKIFLDTNIIVYAYDKSAGEKHRIAADIMIELWKRGNGVVSPQVLQEFFVITTRKISKPLKVSVVKEIIKDLLVWDVIVNDSETILSAIDIHLKYKYSFWDSMIISAALQGGASRLYSEDFSNGQTIKGMTIKNPFL
ncbi:MAG: PIN domain-containing protein [Nitrospirae bacterium]|nr:PIN domain-containing protein [Nitrospirota bacterium]